MKVWVKICGIKSLEDALVACEAGADAVGFNFAEEAKAKGRYISPDGALRIAEELPAEVMKVAVCVNEKLERMREYLEFVDRVQLHGEEGVDVCDALGEGAIKAFRVGPDFDPESMLAYSAWAYLLDARVEGQRGGTGRRVDWTIARRAVALDRPIILAGGLTPENVGEAVRRVRPYGVDTASGVEREIGNKDHERIRSFIRNSKASVS